MNDPREALFSSELYQIYDSEDGEQKAKDFLHEKLQVVLEDLERKFIEREEVIRLLLLALFSQKHMFLIGKPGVGKTYLIEAMRELFVGSKYWTLLMDKESTRDQLFGRLEYDKDNKAVFNTLDTVLDSHFVFLDEMFKASNELLNSLLQIMNEGVYAERGRLVEVPLITLIGASNELPEGDAIAPFKDRMPIWFDVPRIQKDDNFIKLMSKQFDTTRNFKVKFEITDIAVCKLLRDKIFVPEHIYSTFTMIKNNLARGDVEVSDRKFSWVMDILRTSAVLNARDEVELSDLFLMPSMMWSNYIEKKNAKEIIIDTLYGNEDAINSAVFSMENQFNSIRTKYNLEFKRFVDYMEEFVGISGGSHFNELYYGLRAAHANIVQLSADTNGLESLYLKTRSIEKSVKKNILVPNLQCSSFRQDTVDTVMKLKSMGDGIKAEIEKFLSSCEDVTAYRVIRGEKMLGRVG